MVLTVPNTFIATAEAISQARAIPEFVDVDEHTYNMSVQMLERFLEKQCVRNNAGKLISLRSGRPVTAIVPVHLYGQMADMDAILNLADKYGLTVIEDACQAHGAEYFSKRQNRWMKAGSMGRAAAFSFYPGKNLGACGEGGAVTTNDAEVAERVRMLRDHGQVKKYFHDLEGYNGRLDAIQAGILHAKLPHLADMEQSAAGSSCGVQPASIGGSRAECSARAELVSRGLSPLRDSHQQPRRPDESLERGGHRNGNTLSDSIASAKGICLVELQCRATFQLRNVPQAKSSLCRCSPN